MVAMVNKSPAEIRGPKNRMHDEADSVAKRTGSREGTMSALEVYRVE